MRPYHYLHRLEKIKSRFDSESTQNKIAIINVLKARRFGNAKHIQRFHDVLNFLFAYPDNKKIFDLSSGLLNRFSRRSDLCKFKDDLKNTGIAGTNIEYQFFWPMACWLAKNFPAELSIIWEELESPDELMAIMPLLLTRPETGALDELELSPADWVTLLKGKKESDAAFIINRLQKTFGNDKERETLHDKINISYCLKSANGTPDIGNTKISVNKIQYQTLPLDRKRPLLPTALKATDFTSNNISTRSGMEYIDLARKTMLTHERDLDAFSYGNPADVWSVNFSDGHQIICNSMLPERRYLLHSTYGFLNIRNGMPVGYFQIINLFNTAEIAFNMFPPFRGGETAKIFARNMAIAHQLFNVDTFVLDPYQLGHDNEEGLLSGVWWFYYKLGFRPLDSNIKRLARNEIKKIASRPGYKTKLSTLNIFASEIMYYNIDDNYDECNNLENIGYIPLGLSRYLSKQIDTTREKTVASCVQKAMKLTNFRSNRKMSNQQKCMWERWSPLVLNIKRIKSWSTSERHRVGEIISARSKHSELTYVTLLNRHDKLKQGIIDYADRLEYEF